MVFVRPGSDVKTSHLFHILFTKSKHFFGMRLDSLFSFFRNWNIGCSHFQHDFDLSFLRNNIWLDQFAKVGQAISRCRPNENVFSGIFRKLFWSSFIFKTSKSFYKPINQNFVSTCNLHVCLVVARLCFGIATEVPNINAAIAINHPSQIGRLGDRVFFSNVILVSHVNPIFECTSIIQYKNINVQPQRLTPLERGNSLSDSPIPFERWGGRKTRNGLPEPDLVLNSSSTLQNQDPVLNELADRLGVSLKQTEDQLIRDMLQATASFINCVSGGNGDNPTEITAPDILDVIRALRGNSAYSFLTGVGGEDRFGTAPVRDAYFALGHTNLIGQLDSISGFINVCVNDKSFLIDSESQEADEGQAKAA